MSNSNKKARTKPTRAIYLRKRKADDDHDDDPAFTPTEKAESSNTITPHELKGPTELDSRPFYHAQIHDSAGPHNLPQSDQTSDSIRKVSGSSSSHTPTASTSQSTPKETETRATQDQTSTPEHHQALRTIFCTRADQTQSLPEVQHKTMTERPSAPQGGTQPPHPSSGEESESLPGDLEEIDLRSPSDDPDYDIILPSEAVHSSRNAQPDHARKYPKPKPKSESQLRPRTKKPSPPSPSPSFSKAAKATTATTKILGVAA